jgi:phosphate starvation-inducible PhoH-like protein
MKMFLTRLGFDSKAVVTGDVTQIDLPVDKRSGLVEAVELLEGVEGIGFMRFSDEDVVRHPLVQTIIRAYDRRPDIGRAGEAGARPSSAEARADGASDAEDPADE